MGHGAAIGFSPQSSIHPCVSDQILLLSEKRSFRLTGDLYIRLLPLLDGAMSEAESVEALADVAPAEEG